MNEMALILTTVLVFFYFFESPSLTFASLTIVARPSRKRPLVSEEKCLIKWWRWPSYLQGTSGPKPENLLSATNIFFFLSSPVCTICVHTLMRVYFLQSMQFLTWVCIMQSHLHCFFLVIDASNSMQLGQSQHQKLLLCLCFFNAKSQ